MFSTDTRSVRSWYGPIRHRRGWPRAVPEPVAPRTVDRRTPFAAPMRHIEPESWARSDQTEVDWNVNRQSFDKL